MNEQKNNGRGIFYGVIGVATLVVAIIGATFAYFTATASNNTVISGNMATITFDLSVAKVTHVDESKGGMIPMSNNMVEAGVLGTDTDSNGTKETCVDNNGNAVCQIYKITTTNTGTASLFLDGYVTLTGGSGTATDYTAWKKYPVLDTDGNPTVGEDGEPVTFTTATTMRWAQVFCTGDETDEITGCTTVGYTTTGATGAEDGPASTPVSGIDTTKAWTALGNNADDTGFDEEKIASTETVDGKTYISDITGTGYIGGNDYDIINQNFIRISDHNPNAAYDRAADISSALVFNQFLNAASEDNEDDTQVFYIVVWLSETGTNQTAGQTPAGSETANPAALNFFSGNVTFNSAQGSEVTATFSGYTAVPSDQLNA